MVEVRITYETLFDLLRREKSRNELSELEPSFYSDVVSYLREKSSMLEEGKASPLTGRAEQEKVRIQIKNIRKILKELYELREKKILNLALNKIRTNSGLIDTSKMLSEEKRIYEESALLLEKFKTGILDRVVSMHEPTVLPLKEPVNNPSASEDRDESLSRPVTPSGPATGKKESLRITFLCDLPKFMGLDKKVYGPYSTNDVDVVPSGVAEILIRKGRARQAGD